MEYLFIYLLQLCEVIEVFAVIFAIAFIILLIMSLGNLITDEQENSKKYFKMSLITLAITGILCLIPTKQTLLLFGGTYLGKKVITTEKMQKVNKIIDLELDKRIKALETEQEE